MVRELAALPGTPNKQNLPNKRKNHQKSLNFTLKDMLSYAGKVRVFFLKLRLILLNTFSTVSFDTRR